MMTTRTTKEQPTTEQATTPTMQQAVTGPGALTEEHHEAIRASWELPTYKREAPPTARSTKPLVVGILVGAVSLAAGFGAGYWAHSQMLETAAPIVISRIAGPVDANGMNFGRRLAPLETAPPIGITLGGPVDANGLNLGRRLAPFDTMMPAGVTVAESVLPVDANGLNLGRRVAPLESAGPIASAVVDTVAFGRHGARP